MYMKKCDHFFFWSAIYIYVILIIETEMLVSINPTKSKRRLVKLYKLHFQIFISAGFVSVILNAFPFMDISKQDPKSISYLLTRMKVRLKSMKLLNILTFTRKQFVFSKVFI